MVNCQPSQRFDTAADSCLSPVCRVIVDVPIQVPIQQILIGAQQEGTRTAGRVEHAQGGGLAGFGGLVFEQFADGVFDDVIDDVGGGVIDAAGFADLGFFLDLGRCAGGQANDLAEKTLIDLAEDIGGDIVEGVGAFRVDRDWRGYP